MFRLVKLSIVLTTLVALGLAGLTVAEAKSTGTSARALSVSHTTHKTPAKHKKHKKSHAKKSHAKKSTKKAAKKPPRPVTTCATRNFARGESAYFDARLVDAMNRLVCGAADGATIKIKAWFISDDSPAMHLFFNNLRIMHKYHRVTVVFHVGREDRYGIRPTWQALLKQAKGLGTVGSCYFSCVTSAKDSVSHSKFITVSRLRSGLPAVLEMTANITGQQLSVQHQAGVLVVANTVIWAQFNREFDRYWACGMHKSCRRQAYPGSWTTSNGVSVYFTPSQQDLIAAELKKIDCSTGGQVWTSSRAYRESAVVRQLNRLAVRGCTVRIISQSKPVATAAPLAPKCRMLHEKYVVIDTPGLREVISGSKDLASGKYQTNDNQEMINRSVGVVNAFKARFTSMYAGAHSC